jgi:alpha-L-fucosidase
VGRWLKANGDAIYGTGRTPFGEELGDHAASLRDGSGKPVFLARTDWRCTTKPGKLYFILFKWSRDNFALPHFKNPIKQAYLLADPERQPLDLRTAKDGAVRVALPRTPPNPVANVIVVEIDGNQVSR